MPDKREFEASIDTLITHWQNETTGLVSEYVIWIGSNPGALGEHNYTADVVKIGMNLFDIKKSLLDYFDMYHQLNREEALPQKLVNLPQPEDLVGIIGDISPARLAYFISSMDKELAKIRGRPEGETAKSITYNVKNLVGIFEEFSRDVEKYLSTLKSYGITDAIDILPEGKGKIYRLFGNNNRLHILVDSNQSNILQDSERFTYFGDNTNGAALVLPYNDRLEFMGHENKFIVFSQEVSKHADIVIIGPKNRIKLQYNEYGVSPHGIRLYFIGSENTAFNFDPRQVSMQGKDNCVRDLRLFEKI